MSDSERRCQREDEIAAKERATDKPHCYICGRTIEQCDKRAAELGFDECEWLAAK